jgi:murein DD-endopeptidase MepM/ murein hydrolase activator NlpD
LERNQLKEKTKRNKSRLLIIAGIIILVPVFWFLLIRYEGQNPEVDFELESPYVGKKLQKFSISLADSKSGLRKVWAAIDKDGQEVVLVDTDFPSAGFLSGGTTKSHTLEIPFEPSSYQLSDGNAILRLAVWDYSWRNWWKGNRVYIEKNLIIDTRPPEIEVISAVHNLTQGGSGLVIFRTSQDAHRSGVQVGDNFFPAHAGYFQDADIRMAYIGLGYQQGPETRIYVRAYDQAGNSADAGINNYIRKKAFKNDKIRISDRFLNRKMPEFKALAAVPPTGSSIEKFIKINRDLRRANYQQLTELVQTTAAVKYWQGAFKRMSGAANQAGFADHRVYEYKGEIIDRQVHLGIDLASVRHSPVPAANSGIIQFSGELGIYGKTVLIDHGFGLFSMYAHLNASDVTKGQQVQKGDIIGRTGSTGLAGGDHLHFSMLVHNTFVNPIEWWDASWIQNNITAKIETVPSVPAQK